MASKIKVVYESTPDEIRDAIKRILVEDLSGSSEHSGMLLAYNIKRTEERE